MGCSAPSSVSVPVELGPEESALSGGGLFPVWWSAVSTVYSSNGLVKRAIVVGGGAVFRMSRHVLVPYSLGIERHQTHVTIEADAVLQVT